MSTDAPVKAEPQTTTYLVFALDDQHNWAGVGEYTVPSGQVQKAYDQALVALSKAEPDVTSFTLSCAPKRSWRTETFELEPPAAPKFKPAKA